MSTRWIVIGSTGQLGTCLVRGLEGEVELRAVAHAELDLGAPDALRAWISAARLRRGDVLVNAAAYTAVDRCESEEALALRVNGDAPGALASACHAAGARFVHVSTDYVFDGEASAPYPEDAATAPRSAYGRTKLAGEHAVQAGCPDALVVRTSWVYGPGRNFVGAILRQAALRRRGEAQGPLRVVDDQTGCPTLAVDLAAGIRELVTAGARGLLHLCNAQPCTWWDFARAILDETGHADLEIERGRTADLDLPAPRPRYSVLDCGRAARLGVALRPWREALGSFLRSSDGLALLEAA